MLTTCMHLYSWACQEFRIFTLLQKINSLKNPQEYAFMPAHLRNFEFSCYYDNE